ncbi:MAG: UDP-N-acetylmuramate:L-alanyl-gamma-D-glutamyl-meso-diaminopimelate ligase [Pseudomonadota bacterium]
MKLHIVGICGTFMGGIALLARELGHDVSGSDAGIYPPMSTQLQEAGIELNEGYRAENIPEDVDCVVIGNALSRGNVEVESILEMGIAYTSGPQWLLENALRDRWVLAVAGTHGKTTTSSILAWILEHAGLQPGFLIGGIAHNFGISARLGKAPFFVVEADEYDTAFFDKRSKFVHYHPRTLILNNLEFDHADIFDSLSDIKRQFHHLIRTVPASGRLLVNGDDANLESVLAMGCWSDIERFGSNAGSAANAWQLDRSDPVSARIVPPHSDAPVDLLWSMVGAHNAMNALAAIAAARHVGVTPEHAAAALTSFAGVKRRLEVRAKIDGITIYDDFAHHPTAIKATIVALRRTIGVNERILAVVDVRSNTMRMGTHSRELSQTFDLADETLVHCADTETLEGIERHVQHGHVGLMASVDSVTKAVLASVQNGDHVLIMSNGSFGNIHDKVIKSLVERNKQGCAIEVAKR